MTKTTDSVGPKQPTAWSKTAHMIFALCFRFHLICGPFYVQNPLHTFPRNFTADREAANVLHTCYGLVVYVTVWLWTCYGEVANLLRGNWCKGFWPLAHGPFCM